MALSGEVHHKVDVVVGKQALGELPVADVTFHEDAPLVVDVVLDRAEIAGIGERVEHDQPDILIFVLFVKQVLDEVRSDETCCSGNEICFHILDIVIDVLRWAGHSICLLMI